MANRTYESLPVQRNARKTLFRQARLGLRPAPAQPSVGDMVLAISSAAAIKNGWSSSPDGLVVALRNSWSARKD